MLHPHVLFVTYGGAHISKVAPVLFALQKGGVRCTVLALTLGFKKARQLGLNPVGYRDFLHLVEYPDIVIDQGRQLLTGNQHPDVEEEESICYLGINYMEWVNRFGIKEAQEKYRHGGRRAFMPISFMGQVIDDVKADLIISTSSPRSEQAAIEAAVLRGLPSLTMMDLFALPYDIFYHHRVRADRITVLSESVKNNLIEGGVDAVRIHVTGCPSFDVYRDGSVIHRAQALRDHLGWHGITVILWAGNLEEAGPDVDETYAGIRLGSLVEQRLRNWVKSRADLALIVRYHPNQYHLFPKFDDHPRVYVSNPGQELVEPLVQLADTVVVQASTVGYEAAILGKRVLSLNFSPMVIRTRLDPARLGYAEGVQSHETLIQQLESFAPPINLAKLLPPIGPATPRVVAHVLELLQTGRKRINETGHSGL